MVKLVLSYIILLKVTEPTENIEYLLQTMFFPIYT